MHVCMRFPLPPLLPSCSVKSRRHRVELEDLRVLRHQSATKVQAAWRGSKARRAFKEETHRRRLLTDLAIELQTRWRGYSQRTKYQLTRQVLPRAAATLVHA